MLKLALIIFIILAVGVLLLSVNIWLRGGSFRSHHVGQSPELRRRGIRCVQSMDAAERREHRELLTKKLKQLNNRYEKDLCDGPVHRADGNDRLQQQGRE